MITPFALTCGTRWVRLLAAFATIACFCSAPSHADVTISFKGSADSQTASGTSGSLVPDGLNTYNSGSKTVGNFAFTVSSTPTDPAGGGGATSQLYTTTIDISKSGTIGSTDTLTLYVTGVGFTASNPGHPDVLGYTVAGTSGTYSVTSDTTTVSSFADASNTAYGTTTSAGSSTAKPVAPPQSGQPATYTFGGGTALFTPSGAFSLTQELQITLLTGDKASFTFTTLATPTPEPTTTLLAGLGALGFVGYGFRRRPRRIAQD